MDDQTEVPDENEYRVRYQDAGLPYPSVTRPMSKAHATVRSRELEAQEGISQVEVLPDKPVGEERYVVLFMQRGEEHASEPESYEEAKARATVLSGETDILVLSVMTEQAYQLRTAQSYRETQKDQVAEDVDASLDEPTDEEVKEVLTSAAEIDTWSQKHNRQTALDHAMKLATSPVGMVTPVSRMDADDVVRVARVFLSFLNEEGSRA